MVASDTVVGIVGTLVLVAVMVGVFVYELDQAEEEVASNSDFDNLYPRLDAVGDMDGDGTPNTEDDDMDGDGIPNESDPMLAYSDAFAGGIGPSGPGVSSDFSYEADAQMGATQLNFTVTWDVIAPMPVPAQPNFVVVLLNNEGEEVARGTNSQVDTTVTNTIVYTDIPAVGATFTLHIEEPQGGIGGSFTGEAVIHYG